MKNLKIVHLLFFSAVVLTQPFFSVSSFAIGGVGASCVNSFDCQAGTVCDKEIRNFLGKVTHFGTNQCIACPDSMPNCNGAPVTAGNNCSATFLDIFSEIAFPSVAECLGVSVLGDIKDVLDCERDAASGSRHSFAPTGPDITINHGETACLSEYISAFSNLYPDDLSFDAAKCLADPDECHDTIKDRVLEHFPGFSTWVSCMNAGVNVLGSGFTAVWADLYGVPCSPPPLEWEGPVGPAGP